MKICFFVVVSKCNLAFLHQMYDIYICVWIVKLSKKPNIEIAFQILHIFR